MKLLAPVTLGELVLKNSMVMAPMTRSRASQEGVINDLAVTYYTQRAGAGLIVSEAINISAEGKGMPNTPGLYTAEQIAAWKKVTAAVHEAGGKIFAQLNHSGRVSHSLNRNGQLPVAPSAIAIKSQKVYTPQGQQEYETPVELSKADIARTIHAYGIAAKNAIEAGFDGVELHASFGLLPQQFLMESSNQRTDEYGGSPANRTRFITEVLQEIIHHVGPQKAGIKLSPAVPINDMLDSEPVLLYTHLFNLLNGLPLAYVHLTEALFPLTGLPHFPQQPIHDFGHSIKHPIITNGGYNRDSAEAVLQANKAQLVSFAALFLANPDLPARFAMHAPLNEPDKATMYAGGDEKGYTDYPAFTPATTDTLSAAH